MVKRLWTTTSLALLLLVGCSAGDGRSGIGSESSPDGVVTGQILVSAAASLTDAFSDVGSAFERSNPRADVQLNLAGSSTLREQIFEGAPADVFAAADEAIMMQVRDGGHTRGSVEVFARNRLAIAVPAGNPGQIASLDDLGRDDLLIGLCARGVPCGDLARDALARAGVDPSIDTNEPDVRALLTKIGADELDAGIVYVTDIAVARDRVEGIDIPDDVNAVARYSIAVLGGAENPDGAAAFMAFVLSAEGQAILSDHGFDPR